uniref:NAD(P)-binding domain-containing protein n=1 Tax=Oryza punctata TaxID=4537 RepID=A0A0E0JXS9_ORYPU
MSCCAASSSSPVLANPRGGFAASCSTTSNHRAIFLGSRQFSPIIYSPAHRASSRLSRREVIAFAGQQSWDIGRFVRTLYFFNGPPNPLKIVESIISSFTGSTPSEAPKKMETSDVVLVTGATGGVGRRVVDILRKKGLPVRARNEEKARSMLGPDVDLIIGDVTKENTLDPKYFKGIKKVINAVSVIVGPKEGDTPDRQKYKQVRHMPYHILPIFHILGFTPYELTFNLIFMQGIKFFEPEIKGPSPEMVEYLGMQNLINAVKNSVGLTEGKLLFGGTGNLSGKIVWGALDDVVMGGVSESTFQIQPTGSETGGPTGLFKVPEDLSAYDGIELRVKGDGRRYKLIVRTSFEWDTVGYIASFNTTKGEWQSVKIPFSSLNPVFRARTMPDAPPLDASNVTSLQLMYSKFEYDGKLNPTFTEGPFELPFSSIRAYINEPITPRFVHVSSAGVTRPERPGLDLSKQPPAVRMNKELGSILTYKLKGEDLIRESGIPYTIVRPCALTEEPAGADLIFDQGDNITGKISREEIALICVAALASPNAVEKTFEVKSTVPFSEPFVVDPSNPPPEKDYEVYFKELKAGITGKEALEGTPAQV